MANDEATVEESAPPTEIEVLDRAGVEEAGWVIVHESVSQGLFRAEKPASNGKVEQAGSTEEGLLLAISYYEANLASIEPPPQPELEAVAADAEPEEALRTVTAPDGEQYTEAEWAARDSGYEPTAEAAAQGQETKTDAADEASGAEEVESETLVTLNSSNQPEDTLSVLPGEESINDVIERKAAESQASEEERGAENQGIGPNGPLGPEGLMGGTPETYDPGPGLSETEQAMNDETAEQVDAAVQARDAEVAPATTEEEQAAMEGEQAMQADAEQAAAETADTGPVGPADSADAAAGVGAAEASSEAPVATPAAEAKAEELGVDLSTVEGTGADGKIVVGDVEAAASSE